MDDLSKEPTTSDSVEMYSGRSKSVRKSSLESTEMSIHDFKTQSRTASYEEAFNKAGFGLWQYILLLQCGWANASDAVEVMCISFIIPHIRDDMNVSHASLSALTFVLFFGMMIGGFFWGSLADTYGRRQTICYSLSINAVFGCLSALSTQYWMLLVLRFLSGFGAGGSLPACFTYFSEFQPTRCRGAMISALAMCWMLGNLIVGLFAWALLPESSIIAGLSPFGQQWRLFTIISAIPSLSSGFLFFLMPESPKFLYINNRPHECLKVLKKMHSWNTMRYGPNVSLNVDELYAYEQESHGINEENYNLLGESDGQSPRKISFHGSARRGRSRNAFKSFCNYSAKNFIIWKSQMSQIFAPVRRTQSITIVAASILVAFGGYGMAMWTPVLMEKTETYGGSPCRGHKGNGSENGNLSDNSTEIYKDILIGFAAQFPANILTILIMDKIGAKVLLISSLYLSGTSVLLFWLVNSKTSVIIMNALFNAITTGVWNALDVILVEMYPTNIRSIATGNSAGMSRIGSILGTAMFGIFMDLDCSVPILTVFAVFTVCGTICFKLPNTRNVALH